MTKQKQSELQLKLDMMIGQLQQAVRAINTGNYIAAGGCIWKWCKTNCQRRDGR